MIRWALHRLAHRLQWQHGRIVVWHDDDRQLMVAFRCAVCGEVSGVHRARFLPPASHRFSRRAGDDAAA